MASFVDRVRITAKAGNGGNGCVSFHREKFVQNGGPDGGDGGNGGNIVLYADPNMHTLLDFRFHSKYMAENGVDGSAGRCHGKRGQDLVIKVPVGTVFLRDEDGAVVADMSQPGQSKVLLRGGQGGYGNQHFATPTRQAPNFAKPGIRTEAHVFRLELKTIADVGLVGFPNVGKSTILATLTSAKPKIANYHFTTLTPNLGIVQRYESEFVLADIPGLVEGASEGVGLGHDFLRHVERTRLLLHVVDASGCEGRDPLDDFRIINEELEKYGEPVGRPQLVVLNKCDLIYDEERIETLKKRFEEMGYAAFAVSAAANRGFDALLNEVTRLLPELPPPRVFEEEEISDSRVLPDDGFTIRRENDVFFVEGAAMQRFIDSVNFDDEESLNWFHRTLRDRGIIQALRDKGAQEGSTIAIGDMEFDFIE
ncbi:MAG: GTPase ObgE [Clostridiales bacterium]|nr:GTPase ObgE [Clostridiales bacterium]MDO4349205.1 GTPase ObgE [Eubacteriales bacterium]MDY4007730.1 GTPase ObgE [Candidatus Limiplasma sp.]